MVQSKRIQARLLETKGLDLDRAVEIAASMETSEKDSNQFSHNNNYNQASINVLNAKAKSSHKNTNTSKFNDNNTVNNHSSSPNNTSTMSNNPNRACYRCGDTSHLADKCNKKHLICNFCKNVGHIQKVCLKAQQNSHRQVNSVNSAQEVLEVNAGNCKDKFFINLKVNGKILNFEIDSGAAVTIINKNIFEKYFPALQLQKSDVKLTTYCKNNLNVLGLVSVEVEHQELKHTLKLYVVDGDGYSLVGREWIHALEINLHQVNTILHENFEIATLLDKYKHLFEKSVGEIKGLEAEIYLKPGTKAKFCKARPVAFALRPKVEAELESLVNQGVLKKVAFSDWATPIVPVVKQNGDIRICGDFKITLNPCIEVDEYPLPTPDDLLSQLAGGDKYTKIDITKAYLHLPIKDEMKHLLTLNTHKGLFQPNRLMFGIASAPAKWQRLMEQMLQGIDGISIFQDDIRITAPNNTLHLQRLEQVLKKLSEHNLHINLDKSEFFKDEIDYCGYKMSKTGVSTSADKVTAIANAPIPTNRTQVWSFCGLINYYRRFLKDTSTILQPLNNLLKKNVNFKWSNTCQTAFDKAKKLICSRNVLCHYDPNLPLVLATDASPYGVGAVLSHIFPDGTERPLQFASQTLTTTQQRYSQIDKEAYSIIFGVKKFYNYLCARKFTLLTDHKPLVQIFAPDKSLPVLSATRMQHYAIFLQGLNYDIRYKNTDSHLNADALSRLPIKSEQNFTHDEPDIFEINQIETLPTNIRDLAFHTKNDHTLKKLLVGLKTGKPVDKRFSFNINQAEFSLQSDVIMRGQRVVIPTKLRNKILTELHTAHFGIVRMKSLARSYCWWPHIDQDIESLCKNCLECNKHKNNPIKDNSHIWEPPKFCFERVHADYAGPFNGGYYFILVDSFSKWPEIHFTKNTTTKTTIEICRKIFTTFGIPKVFVTDNGRQFDSHEFRTFMKDNGITQKFTAPYHPATNGQGERYVQILKKCLRAMRSEGNDREFELCKLLMQYRRSPHTVTGKSPSELMLGRQIRNRLDLLKPSCSDRVTYTDMSLRNFDIGTRVSVRDYFHSKWQFGIIVLRLGLLHYLIQLDDGRTWKRHVDQIRQIGEYTPSQNNPTCYIPDTITHNLILREASIPEHSVSPPPTEVITDESEISNNMESSNSVPGAQTETEEPILRRSTRVRKPVTRLNL
ncbi:uncharacterized protein K02A2.6-like [Diabrotica virgifera virgifera]|uniref:RNA-directed DNA polymerase n=1 Tax=Diabrotica virgifera virgifera TaxID=50390 RepID=A0ABM5KZ71_DIAVI|nr:uncharacterized protein K02A2.6-like [Diabrotica virgifera virgifera]